MTAPPPAFMLWCFIALLGTASCSKDEGRSSASESAASSGEPQSREQPVAAQPSIVFLGDSLTAGYGLAEKDAFPALIEQKLKDSGQSYRVINAGRSGDTTAGGLSRLDWYLKERVNPQALVIFLGSNDAMRGVPLSEMEKNLHGIIDKARAFHADIRIFIVELRTFPNMGADYGDDFQKLFARVANDAKAQLIEFPLSEVAGRPDLNQPDGIHPNREGTQRVADEIWNALGKQLRK